MTGEISFSERVARDRRRWILRILNENGGSASESILERTLIDLGERNGVDRPYVRAQLRELEASDCVKVELYRDTIMVAELTPHGAAVLEGRRRIDQVSPRKPAEPIDLKG